MKLSVVTPEDVVRIGALANLLLTYEETELFASQLTQILALVSKLQVIPTNDIAPTAQVTLLENVYREDEIDESRMLTQQEALRNSRKTHNGYFVVPAVFSD